MCSLTAQNLVQVIAYKMGHVSLTYFSCTFRYLSFAFNKYVSLHVQVCPYSNFGKNFNLNKSKQKDYEILM